jgi:hypothetical protein
MVTTFSGWLCNVLLWSAIIATGLLTYDTLVAPAINQMTALIALGIAAVLSFIWPRL